MTDLLDCSTAVVKRYGGTLSQFTGDGIIAVFGAPITLEDHAVRACLAGYSGGGEAARGRGPRSRRCGPETGQDACHHPARGIRRVDAFGQRPLHDVLFAESG